MPHTYTTPGGAYPRLYKDLLDQTHVLIAGATGAGKSTVVNGMIYTALYDSPARVQFILLDPKGNELDEYAALPHTLRYAHTVPECIAALEFAQQVIDRRFNLMREKHIREYDGTDVFIIIDELMVLMTTARKQFMPLLQHILAIARAARVHVVACTQSPISKVIPTELKCNFDSRLALRTASAQDSRNIIGVAGCEKFPVPKIDHVAWGMYRHDCETGVYLLPLVDDEDRQRLIDYWTPVKHSRVNRFNLFHRRRAN